MKTPLAILKWAVPVVLILAYVVGWHTEFGRTLRGVHTVEFANRSDSQLESVRIHLSAPDGRQIIRDFEYLQPHRSVVVRSRTSHLIFERIVCEQGTNTLTYVEKDNVKLGEVFRIVLDYQGRLSRERAE
jgi:hypothetical protein